MIDIVDIMTTIMFLLLSTINVLLFVVAVRIIKYIFEDE